MPHRSGARSWAIDCDISHSPGAEGEAHAQRRPCRDWPAMMSCSLSPKVSDIICGLFCSPHRSLERHSRVFGDFTPVFEIVHTVCARGPTPAIHQPLPAFRSRPLCERWVHFSRWIAIIVHELTTSRRFVTHTYTCFTYVFTFARSCEYKHTFTCSVLVFIAIFLLYS